MKKVVLLAALGAALICCTATRHNVAQAGAIAVPLPIVTPPPIAAPQPILEPVQPGSWRITKLEWTKADEDGFGQFVRAIAASGCSTTIECMQSAANLYHDSDPPSFRFHADCAKWAYMLRAYYASKAGLPFSYVDKTASEGIDPRFSTSSNMALERHDVVDTGWGIDTVATLQDLHDHVSTATYRMDPAAQFPVLQDFYSPAIRPGSIRAGTAIYDINGHVMVVYDVTADGSILYMDASPDESVKRGFYGPHVPWSPEWLGGGFKNFRPLKLEGAQLGPDGSYVGGFVVPVPNEAIADFSLEQYRGNAPDAKTGDPAAQFRYNNVPLSYFEYVRASMSNGSFAYNPVYEFEVTLGSLCNDAKLGTPDADARVQIGFRALYDDLSNLATLQVQRDRRIVFHGLSLRDDLAATFAAQQQACLPSNSAAGGKTARNPFDKFVRRSPAKELQNLIAQIDAYATFAAMTPVGP